MSIIQIFDTTSPQVSGYSMRSRYITDALTSLGVKLSVYSSPTYQFERQEDEFNGVRYFHIRSPYWNLIRYLPVVRERHAISTIVKEIDRQWNSSTGLIDAHSSILNGIAASKLAAKRGVPFMYEIRAFWEDAAVDQGKTTEGSLRYNLTRKLETDVIRKANHVTVICEGLRKDLIERGIPASKITIIPNGVDSTKFKPMGKDQQLIKQYALDGCKVFGFIGTFFRFEGLEILIKAIKRILIKRKDIKVFLIGGGQEEENIKRLVNELGMSKHVILPGRVKHEDVNRYYSIMDAMVYPRLSRRITELVTPLKPLEAMALEKVVIGSDVGGLKELIRDRDNGLLFKAEDINDLADKCLYVLDHESQNQVIAKKAREYVVRERDWLQICRRYLKIFEEMGMKQ